MPLFHSVISFKKDLAKIIPDRQKREFIAGYIEGHAGRMGTGSRITPRVMDAALKKLELGHTAGANPWERITKEEASKIRGHFSWDPTKKI